jgi:hypothetical protein
MTTALEGGEGSASRPGRSLPPGKTRYPLYKRLGGLQGLSEQVRKISPPPGFDPRTVQPVASRYTGYATRPTFPMGTDKIWRKAYLRQCIDVNVVKLRTRRRNLHFILRLYWQPGQRTQHTLSFALWGGNIEGISCQGTEFLQCHCKSPRWTMSPSAVLFP